MSNDLLIRTTSDLSFEAYTQKVLHEISPERNREQALNARPAGQFNYTGHDWSPREYPGFAILSMVNENKGNEALAARLVRLQEDLLHHGAGHAAFYALPAASFHQTIANTLSDERFKKNIAGAGLENSYPSLVAGAFSNSPTPSVLKPIRMKMAGLSIFGTAIGLMGIFENEDDYCRITGFRTSFYKDPALEKLDVRRTRPFIGHITLVYIEQDLLRNQKLQLAETVGDLNKTLLGEENYFSISVTGLRRYEHLAAFTRQDDYPVHRL